MLNSHQWGYLTFTCEQIAQATSKHSDLGNGDYTFVQSKHSDGRHLYFPPTNISQGRFLIFSIKNPVR